MEIPSSSPWTALNESSVTDDSPEHSCGQGLQSIGLMNIPNLALR
ncbi:hypothetical protein GFS31_03990 [Leptolyngbya sp. BL0902]|nr:hypothetical protein GFS31_03990 [Leptolyngbya sp. BL0902]